MSRPNFVRVALISTLLLLPLMAADLMAKSVSGSKSESKKQRYVILMDQPSAASHLSAQPTQPQASLQSFSASAAKSKTPSRLDFSTTEATRYLDQLDQAFAEVQADTSRLFNRDIKPVHRYRYALNGFSVDMTPEEAAQMKSIDGVSLVEPDRVHRLHTDAGPAWIEADQIWNGAGGITANRGEGIVIGVIDSGINFGHSSFSDPGELGGLNRHDHENPLGQQLGLCSQPGVTCNDKLIGVYEFVEDDPNTDVIEESNNGRDNTNHGSLVASVAAGNPQTGLVIAGTGLSLQGVAPNANIISYRVCYLGDPDDFEDDGCQGSAINKAIDQAIADGVDIINYSIGSAPFSPWASSESLAFLTAYEAGIFVATSAGNEGPGASTIGLPAMAPWVTAVGSATHDRKIGSALLPWDGGEGELPPALSGESNVDDALGVLPIVHAKDFGFPLCGVGEAESQPTCEGNTGVSNPFADGTFEGMIVVCDRGDYGRVEKGKNVLLAGAAGYVLANTDLDGEATVADEHCLASTHLGKKDGDTLRAWLDSGTGHRASISGRRVNYSDDFGDQLSSFSSRGPTRPPVENVLKPNVVGPGQNILGASNETGSYTFASGTSFSSPHIAGAAALLKAANPDWTPAMISSALETTGSMELATNQNGDPANRFEFGGGSVRLAAAANAGLYLDETQDNFVTANPDLGGDPKTLNLVSMVDTNCVETCTFNRIVSPLVGGLTWTASSSGFPEGVVVTVTPSEFTLAANSEQLLQIEVNLTGANVANQFVDGVVTLSTPTRSNAVLPVVVLASGGSVPFTFDISTEKDSGWREFQVANLATLNEATYTSGGLKPATVTTEDLFEDETFETPYDNDFQGSFVVLHEVPEGALWLRAETLLSAAEDLDLYVGRDDNGNGRPDEAEEVCSSTTPADLEFCDVLTPSAGTWWILVQNWEDGTDGIGGGPAQSATLLSGFVASSPDSDLTATGPGRVESGEQFDLRISWDDTNVLPGQTVYGAVGIGNSADTPNNIGVVPVVFNRLSMAEPAAKALVNGQQQKFALAAGQSHNKLFIDIPPGSDSLSIEVTAEDAAQTPDLAIEMIRVPFDDAFTNTPMITDPAGSGTTFGSSAQVSGGDLQPGRWHAVVTNSGSSEVAVIVETSLTSDGSQLPFRGALWESVTRPGINTGLEYNGAGDTRALIWYAYDESGEPAWYIAASPKPEGNAWTSDLLRFTNDGVRQQPTVVGTVSMTMIQEEDPVFTWTLFGETGSDRLYSFTPNSCPETGGGPQSYTGIWYRGVDGLGGASVLVNEASQAQIHYLFDDNGAPRWLLGTPEEQSPSEPQLVLYQFDGFCPLCTGSVTFEPVGTSTRLFDSASTGSWTLDYMMTAPLSGNVNRTENIIKLTNILDCN